MELGLGISSGTKRPFVCKAWMSLDGVAAGYGRQRRSGAVKRDQSSEAFPHSASYKVKEGDGGDGEIGREGKGGRERGRGHRK